MTKEEKKKDIEKLTRTKLIEEAKQYPDIVGAHGMNKEELVQAIAAEKKKLGEEIPESPSERAPSTRKKKNKKLPERKALKAALQSLKKNRREALEAKDLAQLKRIRALYKRTNRNLRRATASKAD